MPSKPRAPGPAKPAKAKPKRKPAAKRKPTAKPKLAVVTQLPVDPDPVGTQMEQQIQATETLLAAHKARHAAFVLRAQGDISQETEAVAVLERINKLEIKLLNMRAFLRVRALTRQP